MSDSRATNDSAILKPSISGNNGGDEMRRLVQRLFLSDDGDSFRKIAFCGVGSENGSSAVCANAGRTLAVQSSRSVCLVDANLRFSHLAGLLGGEAAKATSHKSGSMRERCLPISENLWFAGRDVLAAEGGGLLAAANLRQLFDELGSLFEFVLIDAPGADVSGDAAVVGHVADGMVLVIDAEVTRRIAARKVKESLDAAKVRLLGTVLHNRILPIPKILYDML